jgi:hypothetical protein
MSCVRALADKQEKPGEVRTFATVSRYPGASAQTAAKFSSNE